MEKRGLMGGQLPAIGDNQYALEQEKYNDYS